MHRRQLQLPFIVSVSVVSTGLAACGGDTDDSTGVVTNPPGFGAGGSSTTGGTGAGGSAGSAGSTSTGGGTSGGAGGTGAGGTMSVGGTMSAGGTTSTGGTAGTGGASALRDCEPDAPSLWYSGQSCDTPDDRCKIDADCRSGPVRLEFHCQSSGDYAFWQLTSPCSMPYDSCTDAHLYCEPSTGSWYWPGGGDNPPGPCPVEAPQAGAECYSGGMGADPDKCGYRCTPGDSSSPWTLVRCGPDDDWGAGTWEHDGACDEDGSGG